MNQLKVEEKIEVANYLAQVVDLCGDGTGYVRVNCNLGHPKHSVIVVDGHDPLALFHIEYFGRDYPQHVLVTAKDKILCFVVPTELETATKVFAQKGWDIRKLSKHGMHPFDSEKVIVRVTVPDLNVEYDHRTEGLMVKYFDIGLSLGKL